MEQCCDIDMDSPVDIVVQEMRTARKQHWCSECGAEICSGARYEYVFGKHEGDLFTNKVCASCLRVRAGTFCRGRYPLGCMWEDIAMCLGSEVVPEHLLGGL